MSGAERTPPSENAPRSGRQGLVRGGTGAGEKPKDFKKSIGRLLKYLARYKVGFVVAIVVAVASTGFSIVSPKLLGNMTNGIMEGFMAMQIYDQIPSSVRDLIPEGTVGINGLGRFMTEVLPEKLANDPELAAEIGEMMGEMSSSGESGPAVADSVRESVAEVDFGARPRMPYDKLAGTAGLLAGLYVASAGMAYAMSWILNTISQKAAYRLRRKLSRKINRLPLSYFDKQSYGDVLSRITNDVDTIAQNLNQGLSQIVTSVVSVVGILVMMLSISWQMSLIALVTVPMLVIVMGFVMKHSQRYFTSQQKVLGELNGHIEESYSGHNVIRAFGREKRALAEFNRSNERLYRNGWKAQFLSGLAMPVINFMSNLGFVGVALVGGWMAIRGRMSIGNIQAFTQYLNQFNQPLVSLAQIAAAVQSTAAASERVFDFLDEKEESMDVSGEVALTKEVVEFADVKFGYTSGKPIIKNFSAKVKPGQRVAIVGPTGAGKTTIVNLLMRFYDVDSGSICVSGVDSREWPRGELRRSFGMVLQDTWLFNGTIMENLKYGRPDATDDEVFAVTKQTHVDHFVKSLSKGYDTVIDEDADGISAGEKQLLTIARAMIADPPMLILDEATSSVDTRTEVLIQEAMERLMRGRTSFVIAHRLSTIRDADLILVMREGNIVEQGTHTSLLKAGGFYAKLYNSQFEE